jgi:hypothetical protein
MIILRQQLFSDSKDEEKDKRKKKLKRIALGTGAALALAGGYQGYKHLERRKAKKDVDEAWDNLYKLLNKATPKKTIEEAQEKYRLAKLNRTRKDMPNELEMAGNALEHPVKSVKTLINNIKSKQKQYSSSIDLSPVKNIDDRAAIEYLINNPEEKERCAAWMSGDENNEDLTRQKKGTMRRSLTVGALGGGLFGAFSGAELGDWVSLLVCSVIGTGVGTLLGYLKGLQNKAAINEQYQRVMHEIESRPSYREKLLDEIKVADGKMSPREFNKKYNK